MDGVIGMFPEGTRSRSGAMARARPGAALLAVRSNAPILPVAVTGTEKFRWRTILWERPVIRVVIGAPFSLPVIEGTLGKEQRQALADIMMQRVADLLPEAYRGPLPAQGRRPGRVAAAPRRADPIMPPCTTTRSWRWRRRRGRPPSASCG